MSIKLLDFNDLDPSKIIYLSPEKQRNSHFSKAKYEGEDIYIKTTKLLNNNGIVKNENRAHVDLEFGENKQLYDFMCRFDEHCIQVIHEKSEEWFNKLFPKDIVEEFYLGPLKHKGEPKLKLKIPISKSSIDCLIYDNVGNCTQDLGVNNSIICVLHFVGLKFLKQQVIAEWVPIQIKTSNIVNMPSKNFLIEENLDEEQDSIEGEELEIDEHDLENQDDDSWNTSLNEVTINDLESIDTELSTNKNEAEIELEKYKDKLRHIKSEINSILLD